MWEARAEYADGTTVERFFEDDENKPEDNPPLVEHCPERISESPHCRKMIAVCKFTQIP